jgi:hypothetical protein
MTIAREVCVKPPAGRSAKIRLQDGVELVGKIVRLLGPSLFIRIEFGPIV